MKNRRQKNLKKIEQKIKAGQPVSSQELAFWTSKERRNRPERDS